MDKHLHNSSELENADLAHLSDFLNSMDGLESVWQCECRDALVIKHKDAKTTLWLTNNEELNFYVLYCSLPEESFRGESFKFKCLMEVSNYINLSNQLHPEFRINYQVSADNLDA